MWQNILITVFLFSGSGLKAQSAEEVLRQIDKKYRQPAPLQYKSVYTLYKDQDSKTVEDKYNGVFYKNSANSAYMKINTTEIVNTKSVNLKVSHAEKAIELNRPVPVYTGNFDMKQFLQYFKIESFKEYKSFWQITMKSKILAGIPYSRLVVEVTKDYYLHKQVFYYSSGTDFSHDYTKPDIHYPRLEVLYSQYSHEPAPKALFDTNAFFSVKSNKIVPAEKIKNYQVYDRRVSSNTIN